MAEARADDDEIFVYMGGDQQVPDGVRRARIHKSVKIVSAMAFQYRHHLIYVEFHDSVEIIEAGAFNGCWSLKSVKLLGVKIVSQWAFYSCPSLTDVEFGDNLETIGQCAFGRCNALRKIRMLSAWSIGEEAFANCSELTDVECGEALEALYGWAFGDCPKLERITLPLKDFFEDRSSVFKDCTKLTRIDLVGGIHQTVATLHLVSWRNEMNDEINRINQTLPTITAGKTEEIQQWMESVINRLDHLKAEHIILLKEATTLLELALWKAKVDDHEGNEREGVRTTTTRSRRKRARKEICVTSGADVVIKNVLPFLALK